MLSQGGPRGAQGGLRAAVQAQGRLLLSWRKLSLELLERVDALRSLASSAAAIDSYSSQLDQQGAEPGSAFEAAFPLAAGVLRGKLLQELRTGLWSARQVLQLLSDCVVAMEAQAASARGFLVGQAVVDGEIFGPDHLFALQSLATMAGRELQRKRALAEVLLSNIEAEAGAGAGERKGKGGAGGEGGEIGALSDLAPGSHWDEDLVESFLLTNNISDA